MTKRSMADYTAAHEALFAHYVQRCAGFGDDDLATASLCPDWDVRGVLAHAIGVERVLDGWAPSAEGPPPFDRMAAFARELDGATPAEVAARVEAQTSSRLDHLRSLGDVAEAASFTPTGTKTYGDFLRIRVFDLWVHARDIALPLGETLDADGMDAELAVDEVAGAAGYIVGKKIGLPDGASIVFHVTGGVVRDIAVAVAGRAGVVDSVSSPDVELTADTETFVLLAAGRVDASERIAAGRITWSGDAELGERAARNLAYTM